LKKVDQKINVLFKKAEEKNKNQFQEINDNWRE
jgi:hypothetical protein